MKNKFQKEVFSLLKENTIAYNPGLARALGSVKAAIFLSQLLFWYDKGWNPDWIYEPVAKLQEETGLSRKEQERAIAICKKVGFLQIKLAGVPPVRHFKMDIVKLKTFVVNSSKTYELRYAKRARRKGQSGENTTEKHLRDHMQRLGSTILADDAKASSAGDEADDVLDRSLGGSDAPF